MSATQAQTQAVGAGRRGWKQPFMRPWALRACDVLSTLDHSRMFALSGPTLRACESELTIKCCVGDGQREEEEPEQGQDGRDADYWERDAVLKPCGTLGGCVAVMFVRDRGREAWGAAPPPPALLSKKRRLDAAATAVFQAGVLEAPARGVRWLRLQTMLLSRLEAVLHKYCELRGWRYGADLLCVNSGQRWACCARCVRELLPPDVRNLAHTFDVCTADPDPAVHADLELLCTHVVYAVEAELRTQTQRARGEPGGTDPYFDWSLSPLGGGLLDAFREVDGSIQDARPPLATRRDTMSWQLRTEGGGEATVIKAVDCLVWSRSRADDIGTPQGAHRALRAATPDAPFYVAASRADATFTLKIRHDIEVSSPAARAGAATTSGKVRVGADVAVVRLLKVGDAQRAVTIAADSGTSFVKLGPATVPAPPLAWRSDVARFMERLDVPDDEGPPDADATSRLAARAAWATCALQLFYDLPSKAPITSAAEERVLLDAVGRRAEALLSALLFEQQQPDQPECPPRLALTRAKDADAFFDLYEVVMATRSREAGKQEWLRSALAAALRTVLDRLRARLP